MRQQLVLLLVMVSLGAGGLGCPRDTCTEEPAYGGDGNDEVWRTLVDGLESAVADVPDAPVIVSPVDGDVLSGDVPPTLTWTSALKLADAAMTPARPSKLHPSSPRRRSILDALTQAVLPAAHAHLPPVTSDAYLVQIQIPDGCRLEVVTTELSHTLDDSGWALLREAAGRALVMQVFSAHLTNGRVTEGPFSSTTVDFTID